MDERGVEEHLANDLRLYGNCFWRVVDGRKVRVPPWEVYIDQAGKLIGADESSADSADGQRK